MEVKAVTGLLTDIGPHHDPDYELPLCEDSDVTEKETKKTTKKGVKTECPIKLCEDVTVHPKEKNELHKAESTEDSLEGEETLPHL